MKFLQTRQKMHSSFRTALCMCQIQSYKTKLFWSYLSIKKKKKIKKKWASEQFSEKKTVHHFPEKKNQQTLGLRSSVGNFKPKCETLSVIEAKMSGSSNQKSFLDAEALTLKFRPNFASTVGLIFKPQSANFPQKEEIFLKLAMLDLCSGAFLRRLVKSGKGGGLVVLDQFVF